MSLLFFPFGIGAGAGAGAWSLTGQALMYAQSGIEVSGATRSGYHSPKTFVSIAGTQRAEAAAVATERILIDSLTITDVLDEAPNTAGWTTKGFVPTGLEEVIITQGSINNLTRLFAGHLLNVTMRYVGQKPVVSNTLYDVRAIDYTWAFNHHTVTKRYLSESATAILQDIVATCAPGFTAVNVQAGLDSIDEITFTNVSCMDAVAQVMKRIGGYCFVDYHKDLHAFTTVDTSVTNPTELTPSHFTLHDVDTLTDVSQRRTSVAFEGGGVNALTEVPPGETILPVDDTAWYEAVGGTVVSGPQRITYTSVQEGGAGALVGPGATPATAPSLALVAGSGLGIGVYQYAYTDVTASGESLPSPLAMITTGSIAAPVTAPSAVQFEDGSGYGPNDGVVVGATVEYAASFSLATSGTDYTLETALSSVSNAIVVAASIAFPGGGNTQHREVAYPSSSNPAVKWVHLWRRVNGGTFHPLGSKVGNSGSGFSDTNVATNGAVSPPAANAVVAQVAVSGIAIGPSPTTSRKVYRTVVDGSQPKLHTTIANNTATTIATDTIADGSLGANAPTSDTSGLAQPAGQVNAGSTSLLLASAGPFESGGGWATLSGGQVVRYTGVTDNTLTGIPASGAGAILATVLYGQQAVTAPALLGVPASGAGSIVYTIKKGDPVNILVRVDDLAGQAAVAALVGGDGIIEEFLQDRRMSHTEALARATAWLALKGQDDVTVTYKSRDINTRSGSTVTSNLPAPTNAIGDFKVQQVTISNFQPNLFPVYTAVASTTRYSFEDLLRTTRTT